MINEADVATVQRENTKYMIAEAVIGTSCMLLTHASNPQAYFEYRDVLSAKLHEVALIA